MKKTLCLISALLMCLMITACGGKTDTASNGNTVSQSQETELSAEEQKVVEAIMKNLLLIDKRQPEQIMTMYCGDELYEGYYIDIAGKEEGSQSDELQHGFYFVNTADNGFVAMDSDYHDYENDNPWKTSKTVSYSAEMTEAEKRAVVETAMKSLHEAMN